MSGKLALTVDQFVASWRDLVVRWLQLKHDPGMSHGLLQEVLNLGLTEVPTPPDAVAPVPSPEDALECEVTLLRLSGLVDEQWYGSGRRTSRRPPDPIAQFCTEGWPAMLNPSRDFDVWWYWFAHLGLQENRVNPLLHYALVGRRLELSTRSPWPAAFTSETLSPRAVRRAFLFAAYDADGVVDDYVLDYLQRLSPHGDIFYLADSFLPRRELEKLSTETAHAWAIPHGQYDFGSYAMLMRDLVGWQRLEQYDEVVLVNDSCYAIGDFDHVFERMDHRPCDWWGFQGSKVDFARGTGATVPISLAAAKERLVRDWEKRQMDHFHLSSYFLALRRPAFTEPMFHRLMDQVAAQPTKSSIVAKYEIGLSRALLASGHDFDTYIQYVYPFHPLYTEDTFELAAQGFPLLKRTFLVENSTSTPDLAQWQDRVLAIAPAAPVDVIERNLVRVGAHDQLALSFSFVTGPDGEVERPRMMTPRRMRREDELTPTYEHWWAFPVSSVTQHLSDHARAIFNSVREDPSLKKIVLTGARAAELEGTNLICVPLRSPEGQHYLLRAGLVVQSDPENDADRFPVSDTRHVFIAAGDTPSLSLPGRSSRSQPPPTGRAAAAPPVARVRFGDSTTGSSILAPLYGAASSATVLATGFPGTDLLVCSEVELPRDLRRRVDDLRSELAGRRLVLFAPASSCSTSRPPFSEAEATLLAGVLAEKGAVLGLREPPGDRGRTWARALERFEPVDLSARKHPALHAAYRMTDVVVSDHGKALVDVMASYRPAVVYSPAREQGAPVLAVDLAEVLPHPVAVTFGELSEMLRTSLSAGWRPDDRYRWCRGLFFRRTDGHSGWRASQELRRMAAELANPAWG